MQLKPVGGTKMEGQNLDTVKVAVLEEKVGHMEDVVQRLDETIEKLSTLNVNISKMIAVHEEKFSMNKRVNNELVDDFTKLELKMKNCSNDLSSRIASLEKKLFIATGIMTALMFSLRAGMLINPFVPPANSSVIIEAPR